MKCKYEISQHYEMKTWRFIHQQHKIILRNEKFQWYLLEYILCISVNSIYNLVEFEFWVIQIDSMNCGICLNLKLSTRCIDLHHRHRYIGNVIHYWSGIANKKRKRSEEFNLIQFNHIEVLQSTKSFLSVLTRSSPHRFSTVSISMFKCVR